MRSSVLPLLEEGEADADGHVVDTQRNGVSLLWTVLKTEIKKKKNTANIKQNSHENNNIINFLPAGPGKLRHHLLWCC